jgi:predicted AAA+ superfamily ATPase
MQWIDRNVEPTITKWISTPSSVVLVRGHRRTGKSSTVIRVATKLKIDPIIIYLTTNENDIIDQVRIKFGKYYSSGVNFIFDVGMAELL